MTALKPHRQPSRRVFMAQATSSLVASTVAYGQGPGQPSKNDRPAVALIGAGWQPETRRQGRGLAIGRNVIPHADLVAVCDVDTVALGFAHDHLAKHAGVRPQAIQTTGDYREILARDDIDAVLIATPDHWHTKIAVEAMRAGKDVYCEKPATVTIGEGKLLREVASKTGRVIQVGTQQRSEYDDRFVKAIAMIRAGRLGTIRKVKIGLEPGWKGGDFPAQEPPSTLDWDRWLGPAPMADYRSQRTHRTFRWWYEYAGGQLCDWGAHHVDIAQWAIGQHERGPTKIEATSVLNQPLNKGMPTRQDSYNTPIEFAVTCRFDNDVEFLIDASRNGITFEGSEGRIFVNRGKLEGVPVNQLKENPLANDAVTEVRGGRSTKTHMQDFVDCMGTRNQPISDIATHHRTLSTCHLANIAVRLGRPINWDWQTETIVGDEVASSLMDRTYRDGYQIEG